MLRHLLSLQGHTSSPGTLEGLKKLRVSVVESDVPYRLCHRDESVKTDQNNVEDGSAADQVIGHQPELAQALSKLPLACQDVRDVQRDAKSTCGY